MVSSITNNLGFGISKYYEDNRNLVIGVSNYFGANCISSFVYENDALGRRTERLDFDENLLVKTNSFAYNHYSEVTNAIMNTHNYNFTMDDIGNRENYSVNNYIVEYDCNSVNQYVNKSFNNMGTNFFTSYHHDSDGNLVDYSFSYNDGSGWQQQFAWIYTWNAENRLTSVTNYLDDTYVTYKYDYQGRMFEKVTNGVTNHFVWQGNHIIAEFTDSSTNYFTWANGETLTANLNGETVFYCHDANKNVTDLVDTDGDIVAHYKYSPFGVITDQSDTTLAEANPF